jgi:hypothetical protein
MSNHQEDPTLAYLTVKQRLDEAERTAEALAQKIVTVGGRLDRGHWKWIGIAGIGPRFPDMTERGPQVGGRLVQTWPTPEELGEALSTWHRVLAEAKQAWELVPDTLRAGLRPPVEQEL